MRVLSSIFLLFFLAGCASVKMQETALIKKPHQNKALVNFVRQSIFVGDGINLDIWDGEKIAGAIPPNAIVQYEATPGLHTFMIADNQGAWHGLTIDLKANKEYYLKANVIPFKGLLLGQAYSDDPRIKEWKEKYKPMKIVSNGKEVKASRIKKAKEMLAKFSK